MIDPLIDNLVEDLKPTKSLNLKELLYISFASLLVILAIVLGTLGLRPDFHDAMMNGTMIWKTGGFTIALLGALSLTLILSRPENKMTTKVLWPFFIIIALLLWRCIDLGLHASIFEELLNLNLDGSAYCLSVVIGGGLFTFGLLWTFWLRKSASSDTKTLGTMAGLLSGSIASTAYSMHCNMDHIFYVLTCYWLPVIALGIFGRLVCGKFLKW